VLVPVVGKVKVRRTKNEGGYRVREHTRIDGTKGLRHVVSMNVRLPDGSMVRVEASSPDSKAKAFRDARDKADLVRKNGRPNLSKATVAEYLDDWLSTYIESEVEKTTFAIYTSTIRLHVVPHVGSTRISHLKSLKPAELYAAQRKAGASTRISQISYRLLKACFTRGLAASEIPCNPFALEKMPRHQGKRFRTFTQDEAKRFIEAVKDDRLCALYLLAIACGLRQGELFALRWHDLSGNLLSISRQVRNLSGVVSIVERTKNGLARNVTIPAFVVKALDEHRESLADEGLRIDPDALIFPDCDGGPLRRENVRQRSFYPLLERAELPKIRFHDLRHSCATLLFHNGVDAQVVQALLGHASVAFTLSVYVGANPRMGKIAADAMDSIFS